MMPMDSDSAVLASPKGIYRPLLRGSTREGGQGGTEEEGGRGGRGGGGFTKSAARRAGNPRRP